MGKIVDPDLLYTCILCGKRFHPNSTRQKCCNSIILRKCAYCGNEFETHCTTSDTKQTCSEKCQVAFIKSKRETSAKLSKKICKWCGEEFEPSSVRDVYCKNPHYQTCAVCGNQFEIDVRRDSSVKTCSKTCRYKLASENKDIEAMVSTLRNTMQSKHGVDNPMQLHSSVEKIKETNRKKHGVDWYTQTDEYKQRVKATSLENYGTRHFLSSEVVKNKRAETLKNKGVDNVFQLDEVKQKSKDTNREKFGVEYVSQSPEIHKRMMLNKENNIAKDGKRFDSNYELQFYNFLLNLGYDNIETQVPLTFEYAGKQHITLIDFKVDNILLEVKGPHLLDGVYDYAQTVPISAKLDVYRQNHVIVITDKTDKVNSIFGQPNSSESNGLKYSDKCPNPLIGVDFELFKESPKFPYAKDRPKCFYDVRVDGKLSSHEAFYDPEIRWKMILNRINYSGGFIDSKQILTAMNVTRTCKQPSWFSKERAKSLITNYCSSDNIYDLAAGWGARADACKELNREYIACDYNKDLVQWYDEVGKTHIEWCDGREFKTDKSCSIFICPPYSDPNTGRCFEDYNFEGFDESAQSLTQCQWLEIAMKNAPNFVDATMVCKVVDPGWEKYVVETIQNKSHLGVNNEYVIHVTK